VLTFAPPLLYRPAGANSGPVDPTGQYTDTFPHTYTQTHTRYRITLGDSYTDTHHSPFLTCCVGDAEAPSQ
jgi:hypothetical protein